MTILHEQGAAAALAFLRSSMRAYNANSFCTQVYSVRSLYYERFGAPPGYTPALAALWAAVNASSASNEPVHEFLQRNYRDQRAYARSLCRSNRTVSSDAVVRAAYRQVCANIEHKALENFRPTAQQAKKKREEGEKARQIKSSAGRKVVRDGDACVRWCVDVFQRVNQEEILHEDIVCVALLLTTGRRTSEIRTGLSTFQQQGENPYQVRFAGQMKTTDRSSYCFQALLPITLWISAYTHYFQLTYADRSRRLRELNRDSELEDPAAAERLRRVVGYEFQHPTLTAHDLRAMYARIAYVRFDHASSTSFNAFARVQLGHKHLAEPTTYDRVHVDGLLERRPEDRIEVDYVNAGCAEDDPPQLNTSNGPAF